jgi:hypothetical protein
MTESMQDPVEPVRRRAPIHRKNLTMAWQSVASSPIMFIAGICAPLVKAA